MSRKIWIASFSLLPVMAGVIVFATPLFKLRTVLCQVDTDPCPAELLAYLANFKQRNLLFLDRSRLSRDLTKLYPNAAQSQLVLKLPSTLRVVIRSRTPVALLATPEGPVPLDSSGTRLQGAEVVASLPLVDLGTPSGELVATSLRLIGLLRQAFIEFTAIISTQAGVLEVKLGSGQQAWFSTLKNLNSQVNSLQLILHQSTIVPPASIIDVRFDKPVLTN